LKHDPPWDLVNGQDLVGIGGSEESAHAVHPFRNVITPGLTLSTPDMKPPGCELFGERQQRFMTQTLWREKQRSKEIHTQLRGTLGTLAVSLPTVFIGEHSFDFPKEGEPHEEKMFPNPLSNCPDQSRSET
jgi:hypothetical protein